jgi:mono/diheme cytochrome c family protein
MLKDADPQIRIQAIRASETLYKGGDKTLGDDWKAATKDADVNVVIQAMLTLNTLKVPSGDVAIRAAMASNKARGVQLVANTILDPEVAAAATATARGGFRGDPPPAPPTPAEQALLDKGKTIYGEVCMACHGADGHGEPVLAAPSGTTHAPALAASPRVLGHRDYVINVLLHGLTGPVNGQTYADQVMVPMGQNNDEWIASVASYVRTSFGNQAPMIVPSEVARVRASTSSRTNAWTLATLEPAVPRQLIRDAGWKVTASHNAQAALNVLGFEPWSSGTGDAAGVWLQIELPRDATLAEIQFQTPAPLTPGAAGGGGGGRGRGGPPPAAVAPPRPQAERDYQVQVSSDGVNWKTVASAHGTGSHTEIAFPPAPAKFARLTQTGASSGAPPWNVALLRLFEVTAN